MAEFADHAVLKVQAGHGGHGCASVHREKFKPLGGPDGGNGGRGGSVILEVDASTSTLLDFHRRPVRKAANGNQGEGSNRNGAAGDDQVVKVPTGTVVVAESGFRTRAELDELADAGVDAVLVGEALMRSPNIEAACRALAT